MRYVALRHCDCAGKGRYGSGGHWLRQRAGLHGWGEATGRPVQNFRPPQLSHASHHRLPRWLHRRKNMARRWSGSGRQNGSDCWRWTWKTNCWHWNMKNWNSWQCVNVQQYVHHALRPHLNSLSASYWNWSGRASIRGCRLHLPHSFRHPWDLGARLYRDVLGGVNSPLSMDLFAGNGGTEEKDANQRTWAAKSPPTEHKRRYRRKRSATRKRWCCVTRPLQYNFCA